MEDRLSLALIVPALATLACVVLVGGPAYETATASLSTETPPALADQIHAALTAGAESGKLTLRITEGQLASYVAEASSGLTDPAITDPRVVLEDGQLTVYATVRTGVLAAHVALGMQVSADQAGRPVVAITHTDFGPLPVPQGLNDAVSAAVREALAGYLGPAAIGFRLETVTIADGVMTLSGRLR